MVLKGCHVLQKAPIDRSKCHCTMKGALSNMYIFAPTSIHSDAENPE